MLNAYTPDTLDGESSRLMMQHVQKSQLAMTHWAHEADTFLVPITIIAITGNVIRSQIDGRRFIKHPPTLRKTQHLKKVQIVLNADTRMAGRMRRDQGLQFVRRHPALNEHRRVDPEAVL